MKKHKEYAIEANRITDYLISVELKDQERMNYISAMISFDLTLTDYENMLLSSMLKSKWHMACIDAGLAIKEPNNQVRRKVFTMLAILEASPNYTDYFLSKSFSFFYFIKIGFVGCRSIIRALVGIAIIKKIKSKCN